MLLHKNNQFIYNNAAIKLPNNIYFDPCPDPCPVEGMVFYSEDLRAKVELHFVATEKDARSFLMEGSESYDDFQTLQPIMTVCANGIEGITTTSATQRYLYEEYVFAIPGEKPTLLDICIEQKKESPANPEQYSRLVAELLEGLQAIGL